MTQTIGEILAVAEDDAHRRTATARILLHQDLEAQHRELSQRLEAEMATPDDSIVSTVSDLAVELRELEEEIERVKVGFTFRALSRRDWQDLLAQHPPTEAQLQQDRRLDHNAETFPVALVAASAVSPTMTLAEAQRLEASINPTQFDVLWAAALDANRGGVVSPKSALAGRILRLSGESATTAAPAVSPAASSSAE